jgi:uncharacterized protein with GYD domain
MGEPEAGGFGPSERASIAATRQDGRRFSMPFYLVQVAYSQEATAAMVKSPQDRLEAVRPVVERLGGKLLSMYFAFGEYDVVGLAEMPDNASSAAFSMAISAGRGVSAVKTTPLMTVQEGIEAMRKAGQAGYHPPS